MWLIKTTTASEIKTTSVIKNTFCLDFHIIIHTICDSISLIISKIIFKIIQLFHNYYVFSYYNYMYSFLPLMHRPLSHDSHVMPHTAPGHGQRSAVQLMQQHTDWVREFEMRFPSKTSSLPPPPPPPLSSVSSPYPRPSSRTRLVLDDSDNIHLVHM